MEKEVSETIKSCKSGLQHQESYNDFTIVESEEIDVDLEENLDLDL